MTPRHLANSETIEGEALGGLLESRSLQESQVHVLVHVGTVFHRSFLQHTAMVQKADSKSAEGNLVGVRPPLPAPA